MSASDTENSKNSSQNLDNNNNEDSLNTPLSQSDYNNYDKLGSEVLKEPKNNTTLNPFDIERIFGFNSSVPVINFESDTKQEIFYIANNIGIFYDLYTKEMLFLNEHQENIISITTDSTCRWIATASTTVINIWNTTDKSLVATIPNFTSDNVNFVLIRMSPSAKFLIVVHNNKKQTFIDSWVWTYGRQTPDSSYVIDTETGIVKSIQFHPDHEDHLMIVFENIVTFICWDPDESALINPIVEKNRNSTKLGSYTDGTFIENYNECYVSTTKGYLLTSGKVGSIEPDLEKLKLPCDINKVLINAIQICDGVITCLTTIDGMVVSGDSNGHIQFFDKSLKLLHWFKKFHLQPIKSISFNHKTDNYVDDKTKDINTVRSTIIGRDFILSTTNGIYHIRFVENTCTEIIGSFEFPVVAMDVHSESPFLLIGFLNGQLSLYNYVTYEKIATYDLNKTNHHSDKIVTLSALKYSSKSTHLACGRSNGELWLLHPIFLSPIPNQPFQFASREIRKITFSFNDLQLAYYDDYMTVYGLIYQSENWCFCGKVRSHYKNIQHILFSNQPSFSLYTIGIDRYVIQYDDFEIRPKSAELSIRNRYRIEQRDIPLYFIQHGVDPGYFLVCDNQHKYKMFNMKNLICRSVCLGPAYGFFKNRPVTKIEYLPNTDLNYLIFMNQNYIGIQKCPIDGNPYKFTSSLGHPDEIIDFCTSNDGGFVFIIGRNDPTIKMMKIKTMIVETLYQLGGDELQPYYCLLDGGKNGCHFQEMQDLFYYMQILHESEDNHLPRNISDYINIVELPDLVRACGYYPSEFEIECLLNDIRYRNFEKTGERQNRISFIEFVKLFINHRPPYGYNLDDLRKSFEIVSDEDVDAANGCISREKFVVALTTLGESYSEENLVRCLDTLLKPNESPLSSFIDFNTFSNEILGIDANVNDADLKIIDREEQQSSNESLQK